MNAIEIVLADGSEDRVFAESKKEALDFLRRYSNRKGATVRVNPGGALYECFDTPCESAIKQAIAHVKGDYLDFQAEL